MKSVKLNSRTKRHMKRRAYNRVGIPLPMVEDIEKGQRQATVEILNEGRTPEKGDELASNALCYSESLSRVLLKVLPPKNPMACKEGCHWCCTIAVEATPQEVFRITRFLRQQLSPAQMTTFLDSIDRVLAERQAGNRPFCALLEDGRCSVYNARPIMCQGWNSHDASACERFAHTGEGNTSIYGPQRFAANGVFTGVLQGLGSVGLSGKGLELMSALKLVLESPDIEERYYAGEKVFSIHK